MQRYIPIDISSEILYETSKNLQKRWPEIDIHPICADITKLPHEQIQNSLDSLAPVVFFPGSTIGNFNSEGTNKLLKGVLSIIRKNGQLILGIDLEKNKETLLKAYDDSQKITAAFNLNLVDRLVNELGADIKKSNFKHLVKYNTDKQRIEMHLLALCDMSFKIDNNVITLKKGETIHTESSRKYNLDSFNSFLNELGLKITRLFTDDRRYFAVLVIEAI